jgi:ssDNA-binding Zn-finger/Zn-ribbon topoisomerase 1
MDFRSLMAKLQSISDKYDNIQKKENCPDCPDCKSPMIKRKSNWGDGYWLGCSSYPMCKKTLKC